jgi:TonB family protein
MTMVRRMTIVLFCLLAGCGEGGPSMPSAACTSPDVAPQVLRLASPATPPMAQQQGIVGDVVVRVTLDGSGSVTATQIQTSPSAILNQSALAAARASTYQAGLVHCVPGGTLDVTFHFLSQ